jgi:hypothetical protein
LEQHTVIEDHTLDGNDRVLKGLYDLSSERLFLDPIEDLHNIYLGKSRRLLPMTIKEFIKAIAAEFAATLLSWLRSIRII